jgi:serine/threonine protein kinase
LTLERGTLLHKRYRIVEILGQGGMGSVYRAVDENLGVDVAVKENLFTTDEYARQFRLEAVILANLRHPNLTRVTDHFVIGDQGQYLVMDYIEGEDLRQRMERLNTITEEDAILIGVATCDALTHLHTRKPPILHRDVKPGNVKITPDGHIFLVDFGLAKILKGTQATTTGARAMTPGYSPPEQYGTARTDVRTDIYSLGATLYAALTGVIPEDGLARAMDNVELTPLRKRNPKVSRRLASAIEKAMAVKTDDRYQTAEEFRQALITSSSKTLHLNGDILVPPPPVFEGSLDIKEPPDKPFSGLFIADPYPVNPPTAMPGQNKGIGKGFWIFASFILVLLLVAVMGVLYLKDTSDPSNSNPTLGSQPTVASTVGDLTNRPVSSSTKLVTQAATPSPTSGLHATRTPANTPAATATPGPTDPVTPTVTPEGGGVGQIAFASNLTGIPQIFLLNIGSDTPQQITDMENGACQPEWAPDGLRLVFTSPCLDNTDEYPGSSMYIINADGSDLTAIPTVGGGDFDPAWSPDRAHIAFTSLRDGYAQIYVYNLIDGSFTRITQTDVTRPARQPSWNPLGTLIAYSQLRYEAWQIWVMADRGADPERIVLSGPDNWDSLPVWSVDGTTILFTQSKKLGKTSWLMTTVYADRKTGKSTAMLSGMYASHAQYSADGSWLVFESLNGIDDNIFMMTVSSELRHPVTGGTYFEFDPAWRPLP